MKERQVSEGEALLIWKYYRVCVLVVSVRVLPLMGMGRMRAGTHRKMKRSVESAVTDEQFGCASCFILAQSF